MKKPVTETQVFCDFCEDTAWEQCLVCGKDLCRDHRLILTVYLNRQDREFRVALCPEHAQPLMPILEGFIGKSATWEKAVDNPEFNEARLAEILNFISKAITDVSAMP